MEIAALAPSDSIRQEEVIAPEPWTATYYFPTADHIDINS